MIDDDEERRMRSVALQNVQSILSARQRAEKDLVRIKVALEEETRVLELLNRTGAALASNLDLESLVQAVTDAGTELSNAAFGAFFYTKTSADGDVMTLFTLAGAPRSAFEGFGHPRATPIFAPTFRADGVIRIADVSKDPRYGQWAPHHGMPAGHLPVCSYLAVPVISRAGEVLGGLFFGHPDCGVFSERHERLIVGLAAQAAIAIDNARLYEQARRDADERARLLETERQSRAEIERISTMKDEFLATLSHELRTPLNAVLGWAEILLSRVKDDAAGSKRGLETIARNARAQAQLIDDLLDMNRIVSGKIRLDVQRVELAPVLGAALDSVRPSAEAKSITVRSTIGPDVGPVFGDAARIQQVVWNLLSNAVKFTPKGGKVDVLLQRLDAHLEITVRDSGMGIGAEFLPHLFERFRQADASTTRRHGGLGLGLAIVKQLVELHGGTVRAESGGDGQGATFIVNLPVGALREATLPPPQHAAPVRAATAPGAAVSLSGLIVLVVDDEPDARELVRSVLTDAGAEVITASSADEGMAQIAACPPDLIVSDIGMPGRDGYAFIRDVRALDPTAGGRIPAIAVTAFTRPEDKARAMLAGFQVHVAKPIEAQALVGTVKTLAGTTAPAPPRP